MHHKELNAHWNFPTQNHVAPYWTDTIADDS